MLKSGNTSGLPKQAANQCSIAIEPLESRTLLTTLPAGFTESLVASSLGYVTSMDMLPDGRMLIAVQNGNLRVIKNDVLLTTPMLTAAVDYKGERGLLGIAHDPNFNTNHFIYIYQTVPASGTNAPYNKLTRYTVNGDVVVANSQVDILKLNDLSSATNHNGGSLHFGADNDLYIDVGENANPANSQTLTNLLGKVLRIDVSNVLPTDPVNASKIIPTDNPFYNTATDINRTIYALGFRNPFTAAIQPGTDKFFINDVGQDTWEEIDSLVAGGNYGWNITEGFVDPANPPTGLGPGVYQDPILSYSHASGGIVNGNCIIGGAFYNPPAGATRAFPSSYTGQYFYSDLGANWLRSVDPANIGSFATPDLSNAFATGIVTNTVGMSVGNDGSLYYITRNNGGQLLKISYTDSSKPTIINQPTDLLIAQNSTATFTTSASGPGTLAYQWQRLINNVFTDIAGATSSTYQLTNAQTTDNNAQFRVVVSNTNGSVTSNTATLTVTGNTAPTPVINITGGLRNGKLDAGTPITLTLSATDLEDGTEPANRLTYRAEYISSLNTVTGGVVRPFIDSTTGATSASFTPAPIGPYTKTDILYRITLTATDAGGLSTTVTRDIAPNTSTLTINTSPVNLPLILDGVTSNAPLTTDSVVGFTRTLQAPTTTTIGSTTYHFNSWSDGGAATHSIITPSTNTTYTANYNVSGLKAEFFDYTTAVKTLPNLTGKTPDVTRIDPQIKYASTKLAWTGLPSGFIDNFASRHTGYVRIDTAGNYTFSIKSDDGSKLWIDDQLWVDNNGVHGMIEKSATKTLTAGFHKIRVEFFENLYGAGLELSYAGPGITKQTVPTAVLYPTLPTATTPTTPQATSAIVRIAAPQYSGLFTNKPITRIAMDVLKDNDTKEQ